MADGMPNYRVTALMFAVLALQAALKTPTNIRAARARDLYIFI